MTSRNSTRSEFQWEHIAAGLIAGPIVGGVFGTVGAIGLMLPSEKTGPGNVNPAALLLGVVVGALVGVVLGGVTGALVTLFTSLFGDAEQAAPPLPVVVGSAVLVVLLVSPLTGWDDILWKFLGFLLPAVVGSVVLRRVSKRMRTESRSRT